MDAPAEVVKDRAGRRVVVSSAPARRVQALSNVYAVGGLDALAKVVTISPSEWVRWLEPGTAYLREIATAQASSSPTRHAHARKV